MEAGAAQPFGAARRPSVRRVGEPSGAGGLTGADTGFVPLPSAQDYMPPREIRRDLEESLQERRPRAYDPVIKDYFRRISQ